MHSLYWRIFLTFWLALALILIGTVTVAVNVAAQRRADSPWVQRGQIYAQAARAFEAGGPAAVKSWLQGLAPGDMFSRTFVVLPSGKEMLGRPLPPFLRGPTDNGDSRSNTASSGPISPVGGAMVLVSANGETYHVLVGPIRAAPRLFGELENPGVPLATLLLALVVSAVVCFLLARYLVAPVDRLRHAMRRMACGDLDVRVSQSMRGRQDDLGLLAKDLDSMAERVRNLLESKQQLLRDVSHELRSPLARLQLALSLARRQDNPAERHLARIACEADRLEQLIARTLKLARLERPASGVDRTSVDVSELLANITDDVAIEADAQGCMVSLQAEDGLAVLGDLELLRDVSHELRSPLARLQLALSLARRQDNPAERHLARIACEADRLEQLIARTLKLARLERPASGVDRTSVDVSELLANITDDVAIEADAQGCTVSLQAEDGLAVLGDLELLRSSFENVIRNAVRYSSPGTQVGITARRSQTPGSRDESVEVIVYDQGPGVPEKDLELIFEPFYRVDAARDRAGGGEGLGLAIAARAVALHGGVIEARNRQSGGLVVSVMLPALPRAPSVVVKPEAIQAA